MIEICRDNTAGACRIDRHRHPNLRIQFVYYPNWQRSKWLRSAQFPHYFLDFFQNLT
jgi:hypothetical protein